MIDLKGLSNLSELSKLSKISLKTDPDKLAEYPGGQGEMMKFIMKNLKYPKEAKAAKIEGTVFVQFKIDTDGTCGDYKILKSANEALNQPAIDVIEMMPKWTPATKDGNKVASVMTLPFKFTLDPPPPPAPPTPPAEKE